MIDVGVCLLTALVMGAGYALGYRYGYDKGESDEWWRSRR